MRFATLALGPGASGTWAQHGSIRMGNIADPYCNTGYTLFFPGGYGNILLRVYVRLARLTAGGISGAEFYIDGVELLGDLGWSGTASPGIQGGQIDGNFLMLGGFGVRRGRISFGQAQRETSPGEHRASCRSSP